MQQQPRNVNLLSEVAKYFLFAAILVVICDVPNTMGTPYLVAKSLIYGMLFFSVFLPNRLSLIFLLMLAVGGQDIVQTNAQREADNFYLASIWQGSLGPLRPSWVLMLYCGALMIKNRILLMDRSVAWALAWFGTIPLISGYFYGSFESAAPDIEIPTDMKAPLFLIVAILLFGSYLKSNPGSHIDFMAAFLGATLARHSIDFLYALLGFGAQFGDVVRVSVDSTKGTVVLLLMFGLYLMIRHRYLFFGKALTLMSGLLLIVYATRGLWLSALLGLFVFARMMNLRKLFLSIPIGAAVAYGSFLLLANFFPQTVELVTNRLDEHALHYTDNVFERYFPTRYAQVLNAYDATSQRWSWLWGSGYGSYYTESAREFTGDVDSAFPDHSIDSGQYFTIHNFVFRSLFEYGIVGIAMLMGLWLVPGRRCFRMCQHAPPSLLTGMTVAMVAFLPTSILEMTWTSKGMLIGGFTITYFQCAYQHAVRAARQPVRSVQEIQTSRRPAVGLHPA